MAEGIESANVVGYNTDTLTKGKHNTMTVQFSSVGKDTFTLNDLSITGLTATDDPATADLVQFWDPSTSGYVTYYLYEGDADYPYGWYNMDTDESFDDEYPTGKAVGTAFWYIARGTGSGTVVSSGEVENSATVSFEITKGKHNLVASAYPVALKLNNVACENLTATDDPATADLVQFWDPATSGYVTYYLYEGDSDYPYGWYNMDTDESFDDECPNGKSAGTAFWYIARGTGTGTLTFSK